MLRGFFKEYFQFTRSERIGTIVLISLIILLILASKILPGILPRSEVDFSEFEKDIERWEKAGELPQKKDLIVSTDKENISDIKFQLFNFDPNTISKTDLKRLGLNARITNTLIKYREKGGVFYQKEDIKKIYGLNDSIYTALYPYIKIPKTEKSIEILSDNNRSDENYVARSLVELNSADSVQLLELYGIGPVFAGRIVKYRNLLGGFIIKNQLMEVYGFLPEIYNGIEPGITLDTTLVHKIDINTADFRKFQKHPYLNTYQVNAILEYRDLMGSFKSIKDLLENKLLSEDTYVKIRPYLEVSKEGI